MKYSEIAFSQIAPNPRSPRKHFEGPGFDELMASVKEKGVIEPIIVRPMDEKKSKKPFEIVAGERRFEAAIRVAQDDSKTIPAIIRELTDDEAFDLMVIENLQREDLTDIEEAESFGVYIASHGKQAIKDLAQRVGFSPHYIRKRVDVLSLPKFALKSWEKGKITFGHLEQLLRVRDTSQMKVVFGHATRWAVWSVADLKKHIDGLALALSTALFNLEKTGCVTCPRNSDVQKELWAVEALKKARCQDPKCFREKQSAFLTENWKETRYCKKFGTNGFVFEEGLSWDEWNQFLDYSGVRPTKECKACDNYVTIIHIDGRVKANQVCVGDKSCYNQVKKVQQRAGRKKKDAVSEGGPRVRWHGQFFREEFYKTSIPAKFEDYEPASLKIARLTLFSILRSNHELLEWYARRAGLIKESQETYDLEEGDIINSILGMDFPKVMCATKEATLQVVLQQDTVFHDERVRAAAHLGIDLSKEWAITAEYLEKKTIKEMLQFGKKLGIFDDTKAKGFLVDTLKKKAEKYDRCKKSELIDVFLKSGVKLVGKVPDEIIPKDEEISEKN